MAQLNRTLRRMAPSATAKPTLVFRQASLHRWEGRLLRPALCIDRRTGKPAESAFFNITENPRTGRCAVLVQGATPQGRRWVDYTDLDAAQAGGLRWARRRFVRVQDGGNGQ